MSNVDHPPHYGGDTPYEVIKVIDAWSLDFCMGSALKYIYRAGVKDPETHIEDLEKALWYLAFRAERPWKMRGVLSDSDYLPAKVTAAWGFGIQGDLRTLVVECIAFGAPGKAHHFLALHLQQVRGAHAHPRP